MKVRSCGLVKGSRRSSRDRSRHLRLQIRLEGGEVGNEGTMTTPRFAARRAHSPVHCVAVGERTSENGESTGAAAHRGLVIVLGET